VALRVDSAKETVTAEADIDDVHSAPTAVEAPGHPAEPALAPGDNCADPAIPSSPRRVAQTESDTCTDAESVSMDGLGLNRIAASDAMFVTDEHQRVRGWSDAAARVLGYDASEVVGLYCYEVLTGRRPDGHPVCGHNCPVTRNARHGRGTASYDVTARARDGTPRYVNNSVLVLEGGRGSFRVVHVVRESGETPPARPPTPPEPCGDLLPPETLTRRELQVLRLFAGGSTLEQVAAELSVSVFTARNHATSIQHKFGVRNRLQMVLEGMRRGLV
jgi:PAS domain S-box-containing protein